MSETKQSPAPAEETEANPAPASKPGRPVEVGGPSGPEPTRFGDWEHKGRCIDF